MHFMHGMQIKLSEGCTLIIRGFVKGIVKRLCDEGDVHVWKNLEKTQISIAPDHRYVCNLCRNGAVSAHGIRRHD